MVRKQFIAGAMCPRCKGIDKVRACRSETREWMECVTCGYEEERPTGMVPPPEEKPVVTGAVKWTGTDKKVSP